MMDVEMTGMKLVQKLLQPVSKFLKNPIINRFQKYKIVKSLSYIKEKSKKFQEDCSKSSEEVEKLLLKKSDYFEHIFAKRIETETSFSNIIFFFRKGLKSII